MMAAIGSADFTGNGFVDFRDYCILAEEWQKKGNPLVSFTLGQACPAG